ncbi:hypothetical protein [Aeoliella sp.]|uniref:hypothetical protein n=1 Tax=Aeoliella sp. TaxID=2795800 RepID=UPI003CCBDD87
MARLSSVFAALVLVPMLLASSAAGEAVVELADGRTVAGQIDSRTDQQSLWLQRSAQNVWLSVPYAWTDVAAIQIDGESVKRDQLLAQLDNVAAQEPKVAVPGESDTQVVPLPTTEPYTQRATSCSFAAELANWDSDVEPDGYLVAVTVYDQCGVSMAVRGTLSATLVGEQTDNRGVAVEPVELERWSDRIETAQFTHGPAVFRLPFRQIRPEVDLAICAGAILQVEVGAFGHGRMASSAAVPVRGFNPIRDVFQQQTGSRFFRGERSAPTGSGRTDWAARTGFEAERTLP